MRFTLSHLSHQWSMWENKHFPDVLVLITFDIYKH